MKRVMEGVINQPRPRLLPDNRKNSVGDQTLHDQSTNHRIIKLFTGIRIIQDNISKITKK